MIALAAGSVSNIILDYVFMYPLNMGIAGQHWQRRSVRSSAYLIIGYLMLIILTLFLEMAEGLQPVFSYFAGVGEKNRSREMCRFAVKVFLSIGILCYLLIVLFSRGFYSIFSPDDLELIDFAASKKYPLLLRLFLGRI